MDNFFDFRGSSGVHQQALAPRRVGQDAVLGQDIALLEHGCQALEVNSYKSLMIRVSRKTEIMRSLKRS